MGYLVTQRVALSYLAVARLPTLMKGSEDDVYIERDNTLASQWSLFAQIGFKNLFT